MGLVWDIPGFPKIKMFIWQIWWERMPCNENLFQTMSITNCTCSFCPKKKESMDHISRTCSRARSCGIVWVL